MVNSINNITASGTVSTTFVGFIILLIIKNAAKYIISVIITCKDKISLVINVVINNKFNLLSNLVPLMGPRRLIPMVKT